MRPDAYSCLAPDDDDDDDDDDGDDNRHGALLFQASDEN